jgi:hypothetical protein
MRFKMKFQNIIRPLIEDRITIALGMSVAAGIVLNSMCQYSKSLPASDRVETAFGVYPSMTCSLRSSLPTSW